jgi:hypothetical protein
MFQFRMFKKKAEYWAVRNDDFCRCLAWVLDVVWAERELQVLRNNVFRRISGTTKDRMTKSGQQITGNLVIRECRLVLIGQ